jgi:hypothetical protein
MYGGRKIHTWFWLANSKERTYLEDLEVDERIILNQWNGTAWTEYIWTRCGLL